MQEYSRFRNSLNADPEKPLLVAKMLLKSGLFSTEKTEEIARSFLDGKEKMDEAVDLIIVGEMLSYSKKWRPGILALENYQKALVRLLLDSKQSHVNEGAAIALRELHKAGKLSLDGSGGEVYLLLDHHDEIIRGAVRSIFGVEEAELRKAVAE